jgi:hypothetical protein
MKPPAGHRALDSMANAHAPKLRSHFLWCWKGEEEETKRAMIASGKAAATDEFAFYVWVRDEDFEKGTDTDP